MARRSLWVDTLIEFNVSSGGQSSVGFNGPQDTAIESEGFTVVRTVMDMWLMATAPASGNDGYQKCDMGFGLATSEAIGAGILPDPNTLTDAPIHDWMWRGKAVVGQDNVDVLPPTHIFMDIRAQRKMAAGTLFFIAQNVALIGTAFTVTFQGLIRCLYLRP